MARRAIATAAKKARGNAGKRKLRENPQPQAAGPEAPVWVQADRVALAEWNGQVMERLRLGIHTRLDVNALGRYCCLHALFLDRLAVLREEGLTTEVKGQERKHVAAMQLLEFDKALHTGEIEMGGTPKARNSLHTGPVVPAAEAQQEQSFFG